MNLSPQYVINDLSSISKKDLAELYNQTVQGYGHPPSQQQKLKGSPDANPNSNPNWKTKPCKFVKAGQTCAKGGDACCYSHNMTLFDEQGRRKQKKGKTNGSYAVTEEGQQQEPNPFEEWECVPPAQWEAPPGVAYWNVGQYNHMPPSAGNSMENPFQTYLDEYFCKECEEPRACRVAPGPAILLSSNCACGPVSDA